MQSENSWDYKQAIKHHRLNSTLIIFSSFPQLCLVKPHLEYCIHVWDLQHKYAHLLELVHKSAMKMITVLERVFSEYCLRVLELFSLEKTRSQGDFIASFQYLN